MLMYHRRWCVCMCVYVGGGDWGGGSRVFGMNDYWVVLK